MPYQPLDIIKVTDFQELSGKLIQNTYYYELNNGAADGTLILDVIEQVLIDGVANIQTTSLEHVRLLIENMTDGVSEDEKTYSTPITGIRSGEFLPTWNAFSFRFNRASKQTRHGQKRIAGCAEQDVIGNSPDPGIVASLTTVAGVMGQSISFNGGASLLVPVIYRPAGVGVTEAINGVVNVTFTRVSSQVSRR